MSVFKSYFHLFRRNLGFVLMYVGIMTLITVLFFTYNGSRAGELTVSTSEYRLAVFNQDEGEEVADALSAFLQSKTQPVTLKPDDKSIRDALFYRELDYVVRIPSGFSKALLAGEMPKVETYQSPNDYVYRYVDAYLNSFLSTYLAYQQADPNLSPEAILNHVRQDLQTETRMVGAQPENSDLSWVSNMSQYTVMMSYGLLGALIHGIGMVLCGMMNRETIQRNRVSSIGEGRFNLLLTLGSLATSLLIWLVFMVLGILKVGLPEKGLLDPRLLVMAGYSLLFLVVCLSLVLFLISFTKNKNILQASSNVISLGMSFLGGIFIPLSLLGSGLVRIARFLPTYWYATGLNAIREAGGLSDTAKQALLTGAGMMVLMAAVLLTLSMAVNKYKRQKGI